MEVAQVHIGARKMVQRIDINQDGFITPYEWKEFMIRMKRQYGDRALDNFLHYLERMIGRQLDTNKALIAREVRSSPYHLISAPQSLISILILALCADTWCV